MNLRTIMPNLNLIKIISSPGRMDLVLNHPSLNILTIAMMEEISSALEEAAHDRSLKVVVFRSEGKHFSAGADVSEHVPEKVEAMIRSFSKMFRRMLDVPAVLIAAVDGSALGGGCELATFCDIVLASDRAKFGQPEIQLGVLPPVAAVIFPRLVGYNRAIELLTTGKIISGTEAERIGLINHVYSAEEFTTKVDEFIAGLTSLSATAIALTKKVVNKTLYSSVSRGLSLADEIYLNELMKTQDAQEGLKAFLEKRKPEWRNK